MLPCGAFACFYCACFFSSQLLLVKDPSHALPSCMTPTPLSASLCMPRWYWPFILYRHCGAAEGWRARNAQPISAAPAALLPTCAFPSPPFLLPLRRLALLPLRSAPARASAACLCCSAAPAFFYCAAGFAAPLELPCVPLYLALNGRMSGSRVCGTDCGPHEWATSRRQRRVLANTAPLPSWRTDKLLSRCAHASWREWTCLRCTARLTAAATLQLRLLPPLLRLRGCAALPASAPPTGGGRTAARRRRATALPPLPRHAGWAGRSHLLRGCLLLSSARLHACGLAQHAISFYLLPCAASRLHHRRFAALAPLRRLPSLCRAPFLPSAVWRAPQRLVGVIYAQASSIHQNLHHFAAAHLQMAAAHSPLLHALPLGHPC